MWRPKQRAAKPICSAAAPLFAFTLVSAAVHMGAAAPLSMTPQELAYRQVSTAVSLAAAIDTSSNAVGVAESELFYMTPEEVDVAMDTMQSMGVTQVRMFVPWYWVEPAPGAYNWSNVDKVVDAAEARGIAVLGAVSSTPTWATDAQSPYGAPRNPKDFGNFMGALASRYGAGAGDPETARISAYEIWNEPHAAVFWAPNPDAAAYTEVLKAGYEAVKAVDPSGTVVGGVVYAGQSWGNGYNIGAVEFIEGMYEAGAAGYFDALSYHPYNNDWKFSDGAGSPISALGILEDIQALMEQNGDGTKAVWTSEYGLPTAAVSEAQQAEFIGNFLDTWSETDGAGPAFLYSLIDIDSDSTNTEDTYGLFRDDWTPKQVAAAVEAWIDENGPLSTGEISPVGGPTLPTEPVDEEPVAEEPVDPVAQTVANWQKAWADAVAGWATAMGQVTDPTPPATTASARTAPALEAPAEEEAARAAGLPEAAAATEATVTAASTPADEEPSTAVDLTPEDADTPRTALAEASQDEESTTQEPDTEEAAAEAEAPTIEAEASTSATAVTDSTESDTAETETATTGSTTSESGNSSTDSDPESDSDSSGSESDSASSSSSSDSADSDSSSSSNGSEAE